MSEFLSLARQILVAGFALAAAVLHEYLRYRQGHGKRRRQQRLPLRRLTAAQRQARYAAGRQRTRPNTGKTQRL